MKMGIRMLMAIATLIVLALFFGLVFGSVTVISDQLAVLLPADVVPQVMTGIQTLLMYQAVVLGGVAIVIALIIFLLLNALVAAPLRAIDVAMTAFAERGERVPLPSSGALPAELMMLTAVLTASMDKVEESHKKDTEISRVKSDFISTAAHQLRTPLTGIRWALEALEREQLTEDQQTLVKSAVEKSHDLVAIVGTLLDISSIESGKYKYNFVPMDLSALVSEVGNDFTPLAAQRQVSLLYAPSEAPLPQIKGDRDRIKWILNNLIENAIRYTPSGGSITVSTNLGANQVQVRVRDTGIGIPEKERGNIFERFYRAGNAITKENQGNGLGLYIARTIATDHGGDLDFQANTEGPGTTFILSFPIPS
ncbi:MAG TPA: HAMP domain-containing sensor histidine kinase [Candidatus Paceibacterota bacterium]|jgi:signal transduction histidine kinase|nr:HAMP domain-containing sensor histidine kinase [Candidatus Paceibacterota bacterium]